VIVPKENEKDVAMAPAYLGDKVRVEYASTIDEVLAIALLPKG
jgi:predicted ATP-dependent protease